MKSGLNGFLLSSRVTLQAQFAAIKLVNTVLRLGFRVVMVTKPFLAHTDEFPAGLTYAPGDFFIGVDSVSSATKERDFAFLRKTAAERGAVIHQILEECDLTGYVLSAPRIAVYKGPGTWDSYLWYTECLMSMGFSVNCLSPSEIASGKLREYDVYVHPGGDETLHAAALWPHGREEIRRFVENGGGYVGSCGGLEIAGDADGSTPGSPNAGDVKFLNFVKCKWSRNMRRDAFPHDEWARQYRYHGDLVEYSQLTPFLDTPVAVRIEDVTCPVVFGYQKTLIPGIRYVSGPIVKELCEPMRPVAEFAPDLLPLDSPWIMPPADTMKLFEDAAAIAESKFGKGKLVFFVPHPEHPGNPEYFRMVANAVFYVAAPHEGALQQIASDNISSIGRGIEPSVLEARFDELYKNLVQTKSMAQAFVDDWSPVRNLANWTYKNVPERLIRLPGYSQIVIPELQLKILKQHIDDLSELVPRLRLGYRAVSLKSGNEVNGLLRETSLAQVAELVTNGCGQLQAVQKEIGSAAARLDGLKPMIDVIIELRRRIDLFRQPVSGKRIDETWTELDKVQEEFNDNIWRDVMFYLDGKAEASFLVWKPGIIGVESEGALTRLRDMRTRVSDALDLLARAQESSDID